MTLQLVERPPSDAGQPFKLISEYQPAGDQPQAIAELVSGLRQDELDQVLLGVTGSGKTFTIARVIQEVQRPTLVLAPNKTLAAQLYGEMKGFFPDNAITSPRPMCRAPIPMSRRRRRSTRRSIACGIPPPGRCWNARMW